MSFGGSGNDSSTNADTRTTTTNTDNRIVADGNSTVVSGTGNTMNVLDGGAIAGAFDFAKAANATAGESYSNLLSTTSTALSGILNGIASTQNFIASTAADAKGTMDSKTIMVLGVGVLAVVGIFMMRKKT